MIIPNTQNIEVVVFEIDKEHHGNIASTAYPVLAWSITENLDEIKPVIVVKLQDKLWCYTLHGSCIFPDGVTVPDIHAALKYVLGHSRKQMADDTKKKGPQDRTRININEKDEVDYWKNKLGVSEEELRSAVQRAGPSADAVEKDLKRKAS